MHTRRDSRAAAARNDLSGMATAMYRDDAGGARELGLGAREQAMIEVVNRADVTFCDGYRRIALRTEPAGS